MITTHDKRKKAMRVSVEDDVKQNQHRHFRSEKLLWTYFPSEQIHYNQFYYYQRHFRYI